MPTTVEFLTDAPTQLADGDSVTSEHPIARLGRFKDRRYGAFSITTKDFDGWRRNLAEVQNGRIPIDYDHAPEKGGSTEAAGWITALRLDGQTVVATIEWTPDGAQAVRDRRWLFVSPSFSSRYRDEEDRDRGPALLGVALTNRPFLKQGMPAISLSQTMEGMFSEPCGPVDIRDEMADTTLANIAKHLGLPEDADEQKILTALADRDPEPETKTLEEQAKDAGKVLVDQAEYAATKLQAQAGERAEKRLDDMEFNQAYDKALSRGAIDATDDTRDRLRKMFDLDKTTLLADLDARGPMVNTEPKGSGGSGETGHGTFEDQPGHTAPADEDSARLLTQAQKLVEDGKAKTLADAINTVIGSAA